MSQRLVRLCNVGFPLTPKVLRSMVYEFGEENEIPNQFNEKTGKAGRK